MQRKQKVKVLMGGGDKKFILKADGQQLGQTDSCVYLEGNICIQGGSEKDVERRIGLARGIWQALGKMWTSREISSSTKVRLYDTLVLSALLYNSETWTLKETHKQRLRVFEMACLRRIEGVTRRDRVRNKEIHNRLNIQYDIVSRIQNR